MLLLTSVIFLFVASPGSASCDFKPPNPFFANSEGFSKAINPDRATTVLNSFAYKSISDCEEECGLRRSCSGFTYHTTMQFCELYADLLPDDVVYHTTSIYKTMTKGRRNVRMKPCNV